MLKVQVEQLTLPLVAIDGAVMAIELTELPSRLSALLSVNVSGLFPKLKSSDETLTLGLLFDTATVAPVPATSVNELAVSDCSVIELAA